MEIEVHDIDSQVARTANTQERIHIRAVAIDQPAAVVNDFNDFEHLLVKKPEGVGVGEHQTGDIFIAQGFKRDSIHIACGICGHRHNVKSTHR
jgi:hypothetical protein